MTCKCARYDAVGNKILPHDAMKLYYKADKQSLDFVSRYMPFRLVVIPDVEIRFHPSATFEGRLYKIYPGETKEFDITLSENVVCYLRRMLKTSKRWKLTKTPSGEISLKREGRVILDPLKRYGVLRPSF